VKEIPYSQARAELADIYDDALSHLPARITRRRADPAVLISLEDVMSLLEPFEFRPEVLYEASAVSIWLPELSIWGRGATFLDARDDLLHEIDQLLALVATDQRFRSAPNMVERLPWIYRLMLAEDDGERQAMLFAAPDDAGAAAGSPTPVAAAGGSAMPAAEMTPAETTPAARKRRLAPSGS
jgi:hypothetical protein